MQSQQPRGIRNKNPLNIRYTGEAWRGLDNPSSDGEYCRFTDAKYGIRAAARVLRSYQNRGIDSLAEIIATWAPPSENNTESYIQSVVERSDLPENIPLNEYNWPRLLEAMIYHENGVQPYTIEQIIEGVLLS